jgi:hypothetical protein
VADADGAPDGEWDADCREKGAEMTTVPAPVPRGRTPRVLRFVLIAGFIVLAGTSTVLLGREWGTRWSPTHVVRGSGIAATQSRVVPTFTSVDVAGASEVTVRVGSEQAVVVSADDNLIELVTTAVQSGTLVVGTNGSFTTERPVTVELTVTQLDAVTLSGSGMVTVAGVEAEQLTVGVPGSGLLSISGTAERVDVSLAGSGDIRLQDLVAGDVAATLSGSGRMQVHATRSLDASVSGTGVIVYGGNPGDVTQNITGTGAITEG